MTTADRSHETIINDTIARILRDRHDFDAAAETLRASAVPDIVVRFPSATVIIESEVEPARTVDADALAKLGVEIDGAVVHNVYAVAVPDAIRTTPQIHMYERLSSSRLTWREWRSDGASGPKVNGSVDDLARSVSSATPPSGNLDEAVDILDKGARRAGAKLSQAPGDVARIARIFGVEPGDESANMAALVVINAMVFQDRLASGDPTYQPVNAALERGGFSSARLLISWDAILEIDYYPIFGMARDIVSQMSGAAAVGVLEECYATAVALLGMGAVGRHDIAGRIFNRLVSDRKLLAAFYTSVPVSTLLAGLAFSAQTRADVDWSDIERIGELRVIDPACGTGTLLMAAYRQILQNHLASGGGAADDPNLHRTLVERVIIGADVVQAAIHITASTLAAMSPAVRFERMQLHTLRLGVDADDKVHLGSLEWLNAPSVQSFFSATEEQVGATTGEGSTVEHPRADLVISNPPYTRRGADGGKGDAIARVFSLPNSYDESLQPVKDKTSELLRGTPANQSAGGSSFVALADRIVKRGGRIAFVLPYTVLAGEAWRGIRKMLSARYEVEFAVSSHDPNLRSMSYDTNMAETLIVARRVNEGKAPTRRARFVNLWRAPYAETDALALVSVINHMAQTPALASDGPPVGGAPIMVGGEQWGEVIDGPVGDAPWKSARWKYALITQFASALERGELWSDSGMILVGNVPIAQLSAVCGIGPSDRQIRGSTGPFESYHGWNENAMFQAMWRHREYIHRGMLQEPNAWLVPKVGKDHAARWEESGTLHITRDFQYDSQRIMAARTNIRALGVRAWFTLQIRDIAAVSAARYETALALWLNSTLGILLQAHQSNRAQEGRGTGSKGMLEKLPILDVRQLQPWQLDEAQTIWRDFANKTFLSFHRCAVDPARIELDERFIRNVLGLGDDAVDAARRLRTLLASDPSIHGSKNPVLP